MEFSDVRRYDPFIMSQNKGKGKKVVVVGHFPYLENLLEPVCDFSIIEWEPLEGDYPMPDSEYLLPEADYAYLTSLSAVFRFDFGSQAYIPHRSKAVELN
nr:DUF364 domain-containing protein [Desulfosporosinus sp. FKB]